MKAANPLRVPVLIFATCGAVMFWSPYLIVDLGNEWLMTYFYSHVGPWWFGAAMACLFVAVPLSILSLLRRDFVGVFGLAAVLSIVPLIWYLGRLYP